MGPEHLVPLSPELVGVMIPLLAVILGISAGIVAIVTQSRRRVKEFEMRHKERMAAIERGLDVPVEPLGRDDDVYGLESLERLGRLRRPKTHAHYLLQGMVWLGVGVAIVFAAGDLVGEGIARLGAVPAAVGIAYLIFYVVAKPKDGDEATKANAQTPDAPR